MCSLYTLNQYHVSTREWLSPRTPQPPCDRATQLACMCDEAFGADSLPPCSTGHAAVGVGESMLVFGGLRILPGELLETTVNTAHCHTQHRMAGSDGPCAGISFYLNTIWAYGGTPYVGSAPFPLVEVDTGKEHSTTRQLLQQTRFRFTEQSVTLTVCTQ